MRLTLLFPRMGMNYLQAASGCCPGGDTQRAGTRTPQAAGEEGCPGCGPGPGAQTGQAQSGRGGHTAGWAGAALLAPLWDTLLLGSGPCNPGWGGEERLLTRPSGGPLTCKSG